jgi:hypothetical protein
MKTTSFETYKPKADEFKIAQPRSANPFKLYVPPTHPFVERLEAFRKVQSLWTPNTPVGERK